MKHLPRLIAIALILLLYGFAKPFSLNKNERVELSKEFGFETLSVYKPLNLTAVNVHNVHPQYAKISTWVSSIGSAAVLFDYDGDKLNNDLINIDPRFNTIFISALPGTKKRFEPFELKPQKCVLNKTMVATGALTDDFNDDGNPDILVFFFGRSPIIYYGNINKEFIDEELTEGKRFNTATGTLADFNGDGHADIFLGNYFPDWCDLYNPNATDHNQIMQHSMSRGDNGSENRIFLWNGIKNGKALFTEAKGWLNGLPYPNDWTLAVAAADINNDLLPDLYIANDFGPDKLLMNTTVNGKVSFKLLEGVKKFRTTRSNVICHDSFKGMGAEFNDINNDGLLDIYVSNIADNFALHESHFLWMNTGDTIGLKNGLAPFQNKSEDLGLSRSSWGWDSKLADFNNDGIMEAVQATGFVKGKNNRWPELQELATTNDELLTKIAFWPKLTPGDDISGNAHIPFFVRHKSGKYFDLSEELGIGENQITRGIAIGDIDHDGKQDFVSSGQWEDSKFYHNKSNTKRPFIGLSLKFPLKNSVQKITIDDQKIMASKFALGAIAKIHFKNGKSLIRYVDGGNGHSGRNSPEIHFSFEENTITNIDSIEIVWRKSDGSINRSFIPPTIGWQTLYLPY